MGGMFESIKMTKKKQMGWTLVAVYAITMIIAGSIQMSKAKSALDEDAQSVSAEAQKVAQLREDYSKKKHDLEFAEDALPSSQCYASNYADFNQRVGAFCNKNNSIAFYNVQIAFRADEIFYTTQIASEQVCTLVPYTQCYPKSGGGTSCSTSLRCSYHTESYTITREIISYNGWMVGGGGYRAEIACSRFSQSVGVESERFVKFTTGAKKLSKTSEQQLDTYSSKVNVKVNHNNTLANLQSIEHPRELSNQTGTILAALDAIKGACLFLNQNLKPPAFYEKIANDTRPLIPGLRNLTEIAKSVLEAQILVYNNAASQNSNAELAYQTSLAIWIPVIIIPTLLGALYMCCREEENRVKARQSFRHAATTGRRPFVAAQNSFRNWRSEGNVPPVVSPPPPPQQIDNVSNSNNPSHERDDARSNETDKPGVQVTKRADSLNNKPEEYHSIAMV